MENKELLESIDLLTQAMNLLEANTKLVRETNLLEDLICDLRYESKNKLAQWLEDGIEETAKHHLN